MHNNILFLTESPDVEIPDMIFDGDIYEQDINRLCVGYIGDRQDEEMPESIATLRKKLPKTHFIVTDEYVECIGDTRELLDEWKEKMIAAIRETTYYRTSFNYAIDDYGDVLICLWGEYRPNELVSITDFIFAANKGDKYYFAAAFDYHT